MKRIASFSVAHDLLLPRMCVSRNDGDVVAYDLHFIRPNTSPYLKTAAVLADWTPAQMDYTAYLEE